MKAVKVSGPTHFLRPGEMMNTMPCSFTFRQCSGSLDIKLVADWPSKNFAYIIKNLPLGNIITTCPPGQLKNSAILAKFGSGSDIKFLPRNDIFCRSSSFLVQRNFLKRSAD